MDSSPFDTDRPRLDPQRIREELRRAQQESRGSISTGRWMWEWCKAICTAVLLFLVVRTFAVEAFKIPTGSMEGTLLVGDFLLVNKAVYGAEIPGTHTRLPSFSEPKRGDIIVFLPPQDPSKNFVKRLMGVPGDTLEMRDKVLLVNGHPQMEPYARHIDPLSDPPDPREMWQLAYLARRPVDISAYRPTRDNWGPIVVPPGKFFALGDNRDNSDDSRFWGFLDKDAVKGRPMFVYYSFESDVSQPFPQITGVRWTRIGEVIR
ncbi:MAG TPA: signal peptidase I [Longimicrobiaceae bacterium]|jgi:signal peptidase I|nr:signal peptidase I [Longimicrobiaceae bacterium]